MANLPKCFPELPRELAPDAPDVVAGEPPNRVYAAIAAGAIAFCIKLTLMLELRLYSCLLNTGLLFNIVLAC